ncbi:hypothetical protein J2R95_007349 [Bradyrhizobium japonicum]|jgi:hypothetical protein|nr:hypothetical protein [Bradyrhizobium japonicum]
MKSYCKVPPSIEQVVVLSLIGMLAAPQALAADMKFRPNITEQQTWDYGPHLHKWHLRYPANPALRLTCLAPYNCNWNQGALRAPAGYKICSASLRSNSTSVEDGATFNGSLQDYGQQLAWYAEFGRNGNTSARVSFNIVPFDSPLACMDGNYRAVWRCFTNLGGYPHCVADQPNGVIP